MGRRILKQPNGQYAIWSSIIDDFVLLNATKEEIVELRMSAAAEQAKEQTLQEIEELEKFRRVGSGPHNWDEALATRKRTHDQTEGFNEDPFK